MWQGQQSRQNAGGEAYQANYQPREPKKNKQYTIIVKNQ